MTIELRETEKMGDRAELDAGYSGTLLLIGAGKMGSAMLGGWLAKAEEGQQNLTIYVQDPAPSLEIEVLAKEGRIHLSSHFEQSLEPDVIVLAVKPQMTDQVLPTLEQQAQSKPVILSIAAGRDLSYLQNFFPSSTPIIRAMPNTPAAIGMGITGAFGNEFVSTEQRAFVTDLLHSVGQVVWLDEETDMDALTAVSGSGPAYVFLLAEYLKDAGIAAGLSETLAEALAYETVSGAGALIKASPESAAQLRMNVTSPGGTTEAALNILMQENGLKPLLQEAVLAATLRSKQLSES